VRVRDVVGGTTGLTSSAFSLCWLLLQDLSENEIVKLIKEDLVSSIARDVNRLSEDDLRERVLKLTTELRDRGKWEVRTCDDQRSPPLCFFMFFIFLLVWGCCVASAWSRRCV